MHRGERRLAVCHFVNTHNRRGHSLRARIAQGGRSHIIRGLPGKGQAPLEWSAATESANDSGRDGNSEVAAASLSISDGGRDSRGGKTQAHRGHKKCFDQRVLLPWTFSPQADNPGRPTS